jgi:hypothetical protein
MLFVNSYGKLAVVLNLHVSPISDTIYNRSKTMQPRTKNQPRRTTAHVAFRLPRADKRRLDAYLRRHNTTASKLLRNFVLEKLNEDEQHTSN